MYVCMYACRCMRYTLHSELRAYPSYGHPSRQRCPHKGGLSVPLSRVKSYSLPSSASHCGMLLSSQCRILVWGVTLFLVPHPGVGYYSLPYCRHAISSLSHYNLVTTKFLHCHCFVVFPEQQLAAR